MKKCNFTALIIICAILLSFTFEGCGGGGGGGGGGDAPAQTVETFHLQDDGEYVPGYKISFTLSGTLRAADNLKAFVILETKTLTTVDGQDCIPQELFLEMTETDTGITVSDIVTTYYDAVTYDPVKQIDHTTGDESVPIEINNLPDLAEIGDFGKLTSWKSTDGSTTTGTWRLEGAGGGLANLIGNFTSTDSFGNIEYTGKETYTIDESGDRLKYKLEAFYFDTGVELNLSGNKNS